MEGTLGLRWPALAGSLLAAYALVAWCLPADTRGADLVNVTIYTSLPFILPDSRQTADVLRAERLALAQMNNQIGPCAVTLKRLDDSTEDAGEWDPHHTAANARLATADPSAVGYIGEFDSPASVVSIPITNEGGLMQISPSSSRLDLTRKVRFPRGAPAKYYPTGQRTFARVIPAQHIEAGALAEWIKQLHVRKLFIARDFGYYGADLREATEDAVRVNGIRIVGEAEISVLPESASRVARDVRTSRADGFLYVGENRPPTAGQLFADVYAANPKLPLFGSSALAGATFVRSFRESVGKRGGRAERNVHITVNRISPAAYTPRGRKFVSQFKAAIGHEPQPYAIYGYEAMSLLLDAMRRAGDKCGDRAAVVDQVFKTRRRSSVLGTYSIDKDGDVTTNRFGHDKVIHARLRYDKTAIVGRDGYGHRLG